MTELTSSMINFIGGDPTARALVGDARNIAMTAFPAPEIALIGDSKAAPDSNQSQLYSAPRDPNANVLKGSNGYMTWALALSGQRVRMPAETHVWSYPGMETGTILTNLPTFLSSFARKPSAVVIDCGTNNVLHDATGAGTGSFASITADWLAIATYLFQHGIRAIFVPILPRDPIRQGSPAFTVSQYNVIDRCNRWLNSFPLKAPGWVAVASTMLAPMTNPALVGAQPLYGVTQDGTHPSTWGAYVMGKAIASILRLWYPPIDLLPTNRLNTGGGASHGNALYNGTLATGTGLASGAITPPAAGTITGTVADACTVDGTLATGLSCAVSLITGADGYPMQQFAFSGSYTIAGASGGATYAYQTRLVQSGSVNWVAGDTVEALIAFEIDAGNNCIAQPSLQMRWDGATHFNVDMLSASAFGVPNEAISGVLRTPAHTFQSTPSTAPQLIAQTFLKSFPNGAVSAATGTIRFGRAMIVKVDS